MVVGGGDVDTSGDGGDSDGGTGNHYILEPEAILDHCVAAVS